MKEAFLYKKLAERKAQNIYRTLRLSEGKIDFCSNDYLGLGRNPLMKISGSETAHASTGSRLLTGNYPLIEETERIISVFHNAETALLYNSGYDANLGLFSCVPQRGDTVLYDYLSHASIRDGIRLSFAEAFSFAHNDIEDLEKKLKTAKGNIFVVTESVFSMDGDLAPLTEMSSLCKRYDASLIVDEAHATGVLGDKGEGLVQQLKLEQDCFARIHTFGKALGAHGAVVLGSNQLKEYLVNFSRAFIYTTALPEIATATIKRAYELFPAMNQERNQLDQLIRYFRQSTLRFDMVPSDTPIQAVLIPGNQEVKVMAAELQKAGLDVRPILYPTVPKGGERLRIVMHAFNTTDELKRLTELLT